MYSLYRQTAYIDQVRSTRIKRKRSKREWKILGATWREEVSQKSWESMKRSSVSRAKQFFEYMRVKKNASKAQQKKKIYSYEIILIFIICLFPTFFDTVRMIRSAFAKSEINRSIYNR